MAGRDNAIPPRDARIIAGLQREWETNKRAELLKRRSRAPQTAEDPEMEIRRDNLGYASVTDPKPASPSRGVLKTERLHIPEREEIQDRRRRPDRRRGRQPFAGPDRRRKPDRRQPKLLHSRRPQAEPIEDRRGRIIDETV